MFFLLAITALADAQTLAYEDQYRDTTDWPGIELKLRLSCSMANTATEVTIGMSATTHQAQQLLKQEPVMTAGIAAHTVLIAFEYEGQFSTDDWETIITRVGKINDDALRIFHDLDLRVSASHDAIELLLNYPPRRLRRHERKEVVGLCVDTQLQLLHALVDMERSIRVVNDELLRLRHEILSHGSLQP